MANEERIEELETKLAELDRKLSTTRSRVIIMQDILLPLSEDKNLDETTRKAIVNVFQQLD